MKNQIKEYVQVGFVIAIGVIVGGVSLYGLYSLHEDHVLLTSTASQTVQIVNFLNKATAPATK